MNLNYFRVIPRDLFNEGKLLTELGFLSLAIHDNKDGIGNILTMALHEEEDGFRIVQDESDGSIFVGNLSIHARRDDTEACSVSEVLLYTQVNSRAKNALRFHYKLADIEGVVFDGKNFSPDFQSFLDYLKDCK